MYVYHNANVATIFSDIVRKKYKQVGAEVVSR